MPQVLFIDLCLRNILQFLATVLRHRHASLPHRSAFHFTFDAFDAGHDGYHACFRCFISAYFDTPLYFSIYPRLMRRAHFRHARLHILQADRVRGLSLSGQVQMLASLLCSDATILHRDRLALVYSGDRKARF